MKTKLLSETFVFLGNRRCVLRCASVQILRPPLLSFFGGMIGVLVVELVTRIDRCEFPVS